jgi:hypothetical protein
MQHEDILNLVETRAHEKDRDWLTRAKALLQSDWWSADTRLMDRPEDGGLLTEKARLQAAIDKIDKVEGLLRMKPVCAWAVPLGFLVT